MAKMKFNEAMRAGRLKSGLSHSDLTEMTGIAGAIISRIETGKMVEPSFRTVALICDAINLPLAKLAATEMPARLSMKQRRDLARRIKKTMKDPDALERMRAGRAKGARRMNKVLTPEQREYATEKMMIAMTPKVRRAAQKKGWETRRAAAA